jgi:PPOX class probable F420-dependent enzyme
LPGAAVEEIRRHPVIRQPEATENPSAGAARPDARLAYAAGMSTLPGAPDWWRGFVTALPARTAKIAVSRADGSPLVTPVWVALDGDGDTTEVLFNTAASSGKGRALVRDPRVSLCWDDERPPFTFVTVTGTARLVDDLAEVRHWAAVIAGRYMGAERAEEYGARNGVPGELLVRVAVTRVIAARDVAG